MKKFLLFSFAAAAAMSAVTTVTTNALAWDTNETANAYVTHGYKKVCVGKLYVTPNEYKETDDGTQYCSYFVKWKNTSFLPSTTNMFMQELMAAGYQDCYINSYVNYPTMVSLDDDYPSWGFNEWGYKVPLCSMTLSTAGDGKAYGLMCYASNDCRPMYVE